MRYTLGLAFSLFSVFHFVNSVLRQYWIWANLILFNHWRVIIIPRRWVWLLIFHLSIGYFVFFQIINSKGWMFTWLYITLAIILTSLVIFLWQINQGSVKYLGLSHMYNLTIRVNFLQRRLKLEWSTLLLYQALNLSSFLPLWLSLWFLNYIVHISLSMNHLLVSTLLGDWIDWLPLWYLPSTHFERARD